MSWCDRGGNGVPLLVLGVIATHAWCLVEKQHSPIGYHIDAAKSPPVHGWKKFENDCPDEHTIIANKSLIVQISLFDGVVIDL